MEALISASLQDGVLTDQEKAVLVKRAQKEGIDVDELDVYIQSLLQKRQQEQIEKRNQQEEELEKEKAKAIGPVCPKCGKQVAPLTLKCECGYEFTKKKEVSSVQLLFEKISAIQSKEIDTYEKGRELLGIKISEGFKDENKAIKQRANETINLIKMFPVPNTKEDIIEFLTLASTYSRTKGGLLGTISGRIKIASILAIIGFILSCLYNLPDLKLGAMIGGSIVFMVALVGTELSFIVDQDPIHANRIACAWHDKFDQVLMKGRSLQGDPDFQKQLDYFENKMEENDAESKKIFDIKLFG